MNFISEDIIKYSKNINKEVNEEGPNVLRLIAAGENNLRMQNEYIGKYSSICPMGDADVLGSDIDWDKSRDVLNSNYHNQTAVAALGCATYSTMHMLSEDSGSISQRARLKNSMHNMKKFGSDSAYGIAMTGNDGDYVLKVSKNDNESDGAHELFVALVAINKLRKIIPNMTIVVSGIKCSRPIIDPDTKKVISFCNNKSPDLIQYVQYEKITPSVSFKDFSLTARVDDYMSQYLQFLYATQIASDLVGYTHYDAHVENVLVQTVTVPGLKTGDKFCIPYTNYKTKETVYVTSNAICKIIDYGKTTVDYMGVPIGGNDQVYFEKYGETVGPWPLHDAYKLLMFTGYVLIKNKKNTELFNVLSKIFYFFNKTETYTEAILRQRDIGYGLPRTNKTKKFNIYHLINYITENCGGNKMVSLKPNYPIFQCTSCYTYQGVIDNVLLTKYNPDNFFDFYDIARHLGMTSRNNYDELVKNFNYPFAANHFKKRVETDTLLMKKYLASDDLNNIPEIPSKITSRQLANKTILQKMSLGYNRLIGAISLYEDVSLWLKVGMSVAVLMNDNKMSEYINLNRNGLKTYNSVIITFINIYRSNYRNYYNIIVSDEWDIYSSRYPWYTSSSSEIVHLHRRFNKDLSELFVEDRLPSTLKQNAEVGNRKLQLVKDENGRSVGIDVNL